MAATYNVQTLISPPGDEFYTSKDTSICYLALPHLTVARRLLEIVAKVTNLETVKIEFRHLRFLLLSSSTRLAPLREQCRDQNTHEQS